MKNPLNLLILLAGLCLIWADFSFAQNRSPFYQDSMKVTLDTIVVTANEEKESPINANMKSFSFGDQGKQLTIFPGVTSVGSFIAEDNVDNLPSQFTGMYFGKDMLLPIVGNKTTFQGANSIVHPDMFELILEADGYSASYGNIGGIKRMISKSFKGGFSGKVSSDFTTRYVFTSVSDTLFGLNLDTRNSLRQIKILSLISKEVPELKLLPEVIDIETHLNLSHNKTSFESYFLLSNQKQDVEGNASNEEIGINQNTSHNVVLAIIRQKLDYGTLKFGGSYEDEGEDSEIKIYLDKSKNMEFLKNITLNSEFSGERDEYRIGFAYASIYNSKPRGEVKREVYNLYSEKKFILGNFLITPSLSFSLFKNKFSNSESIKLNYFGKGFEGILSFGKYETFLFNKTSIMEKRSFVKIEEVPDKANHFSLGGNFKINSSLLSSVDASFFLKFLNLEFQDEGIVNGSSKGLRFLLKSNLLNSILTGYLAKSNINSHEVSGTLSYDFSWNSSVPIFEFLSFNFQVSLRDGIWSKNQTSGEYSRFENSYFLNAGFSSNFKILDSEVEVVCTGFNLVGKPAELIRYYSGEELISKKAPIWGNLMISVSF